jgi:hypothetical protein
LGSHFKEFGIECKRIEKSEKKKKKRLSSKMMRSKQIAAQKCSLTHLRNLTPDIW